MLVWTYLKHIEIINIKRMINLDKLEKFKYDRYVTVMFPYPSGSGLHVGHWYNYAITDSYCRWLKYKIL